eukprot:1109451-Pyramimonas_sp.AAC.1
MAGPAWGVFMGAPCQTWTRARDTGPLRDPDNPRPCLPSRLRSDQELMGLSDLKHPGDLEA